MTNTKLVTLVCLILCAVLIVNVGSLFKNASKHMILEETHPIVVQTDPPVENVFERHFKTFKARKTTATVLRTTKTTIVVSETTRFLELTTTNAPKIVSKVPFCANLPESELNQIILKHPAPEPQVHWKQIKGMRKSDPMLWISTNDPKTDRYISGTIHSGRLWEPEIIAQIRRRIRGPQHTFVDVGANVGYFSLLAAQTGAKVHSFEAVHNNCARMLATRERNKISPDQWHIYCNAVDAVANVYLRLSTMDGRKNSGNHVVNDNGDIEAATTTLDSHLSAPVDLLKIDVQGYEARVIAGAVRLIESDFIRAIIVNYSARNDMCDWKKMEKWLAKRRLRLRNMNGGFVRLFSGVKTPNMMYVHD